MKNLLILPILVLSMSSYASEKSQCHDIKTCVELVSKLTGKKYILDKDVKGSLGMTKNFKITKSNADEFIAYALNMSGYTRTPFNKDEWSVINARDVRYAASPMYTYPKDKVPETYDYITVSIKLKNPHLSSEVSRNFRPFMSRYGRIIDIKKPGMIIISDTGKNAHRLIKMIKAIDKKPTKDELEKYQEDKEQRQKISLLKAKNCSDQTQSIEMLKSQLSALQMEVSRLKKRKK